MINIKREFHDISTRASKEIKELAIFAEASKYIYQHFTTTADAVKDEKILPNKDYGVTIEEVIEQITNQTITAKLFENVIVRAYGTLEVYIQKIATLLISNYPTKYLGNKDVKVAQLFEGNIDKIKSSFIAKAISDNTSNKNMYEAIVALIKPFNVDLGIIVQHETDIRDIYALRNLIVHKNTEIDSKFLEMYSHSDGLIEGEKLEIEYVNMTTTVNRINRFMSAIYNTMKTKNWGTSQSI